MHTVYHNTIDTESSFRFGAAIPVASPQVDVVANPLSCASAPDELPIAKAVVKKVVANPLSCASAPAGSDPRLFYTASTRQRRNPASSLITKNNDNTSNKEVPPPPPRRGSIDKTTL